MVNLPKERKRRRIQSKNWTKIPEFLKETRLLGREKRFFFLLSAFFQFIFMHSNFFSVGAKNPNICSIFSPRQLNFLTLKRNNS